MLATYRRILNRPGHAAVQRDRPGRPAADLDGRARHRAAGRARRPAPTALAGSVSAAYAGRPARPSRSCRAGCSTGSGRPGCCRAVVAVCGVGAGAADVVGRGGLADRRRVRPGGRRRRRRSPRSAPASGPAGRTCSSAPARRADRVRAGGGRRRGRLHARPDPGHGARHRRAPGRRARRRRSPPACVGTLAFAAQRATEPPPHPRPTDPRRPAAAALAHAGAAHRGLSGPRRCCSAPPRSPPSRSPRSRAAKATPALLLALWAFGSLLAGVDHRRRSPGGAARSSGCAAAPSAWPRRWLPLPFIDSMRVMGVVLLARRASRSRRP